jgi:AraC family transcriptional regulator, transcriptional activator of pobA
MDSRDLVLYNSNMHDAGKSPIRSYNLFGETRDLPDVIHCETIPARAALYGWEVAPHRHARLHQVLMISRGGGHATLEGNVRTLRSMTLINVPTGQVHGYSFERNTQGWVVTLATELLDQMLIPSEGVGRTLSAIHVIRATPEMRKLMMAIFSEYGARNYARAHVLRALSSALLGLLARRAVEKGADNKRHSDGSDLVKRFETLVDQHFSDHWSIAQYAEALTVTPTHLSRLTRAAFGLSASHVVRERVVREARRNLAYTDLPISTIAYALGFEDPAYFSRMFAEATGVSPKEFRDKIHSRTWKKRDN